MKIVIISCLFLISIIPNVLFANNMKNISNEKKDMFFDLFLGTQVSGIRKEDYVLSNYSPYFQLSLGKWFTPYLALAISYQGPYFNFIGDDLKHKYLYINGDAIINVNRLFWPNYAGFWSINIFVGSGYFYNIMYKRPNICANGGLTNEFNISENMSLKLKLSAILGWDIYQGDQDILPNISIGFSVYF